MIRNRALLFTTAFGLIAVSAYAIVDTRRIRVESEDGRREYRRIDHDGQVRLVRRLSDKPCIQGMSWGYDRNGIWVDRGCRAEFEIGTQDRWDNRRNDRWDDRRNDQDHGVTFRLESEDGGREYKRIDTRGGVRMVRQLSDRDCVQGRTWGFDRDRVWVDRGCRAIFEVGGRNGNGYGFGRRDWSGPSWMPGRYSGYDNGREFILVIDRNGSASLRRRDDRGWSDDETGYCEDDSIYLGNWIYQMGRSGNNFQLQSKWDSKRRISLKRL